MIVSDAPRRAFQSTSKMQIFDHPSSNFNLQVSHIFQHAPHDLTNVKLKQTESYNFDNGLTLFVVKGRSQADLTCFQLISHYSSHINIKQKFTFVYTTLISKFFLTCFSHYSSHRKQKFAFVYTRLTSDVHRLLSTYYWSNTMNL